jgi:hypothetical protein
MKSALPLAEIKSYSSVLLKIFVLTSYFECSLLLTVDQNLCLLATNPLPYFEFNQICHELEVQMVFD